MNDRFKFRVWSKANNKWCDEDYQFIDNDGNVLVSRYDDDIYYHCLPDDVLVVNQCTGLKDKNGNLIYEGDVLKNHREEVCVVHWINETCQFALYDEEGNLSDLMQKEYLSSNWEIVGNIHKSPELLRTDE